MRKIAFFALLTIAGLLANYVLFAGSSDIVDSLTSQSDENGQAVGKPPNES